MKEHIIRFWGVRGSFPTPDRDKYNVGGHTSCVEVRTADNQLIVFDMGTGFVPFGNALMTEKNAPDTANVFISHFHWDHIIGYLGFTPFFNDKFTCNIYGKEDKLDIHTIFGRLHDYTFWPVEIPLYQAKFNLHTFPKEEVSITENITVQATLHGHPNGANSYRLTIGDKVIVYSTDIEHPEHQLNPNVLEIAKDADVLIKDAQFTNEQLPTHKGWGHSSWQQCVAVAEQSNVKQLVLYHHSPGNNDDAVAQIEKDAQAEFANTIAAREGLEIRLPV